MEYNYSIIIPHKNCFSLLRRLINTIPQRNDIQIIVVDDNSIYNQSDIDFLNNSINVHFIRTYEGKGAGYARNVGLSLAKGKWLIFADADDTFMQENLNKAMDQYLYSNYDIVFFDANCIDEETGIFLPNLDQQYKRFIYAKSNKIDKCRFNIRVPWAKFIRRDFVEEYKIIFDETLVANDIMFATKIGFYSHSVEIVDVPIYNWMVQKNSITTNKTTSALMLHFLAAVKRNKFLEENYMYKFRRSLFPSLFSLHYKAGLSWKDALKKVLEYTPVRFLMRDILHTFVFYSNKLISRL